MGGPGGTGADHPSAKVVKIMMRFEKHIDVQNSEVTAVQLLAESTELSKQAIKKAMTMGAVWLTRRSNTQRIRRAVKSLKPGDRLHLYYDEAVLSQQPRAAELLADEGAFSVWNKPGGMLSQGSKWGDHCAINRWVEKNTEPQRDAFVVHRLDRAAKGLMIIAHKKKVAAYFSDLFQKREIEKAYEAIVHGKFPEALDLDSPVDGKQAISRAKRIEYNADSDQSLVYVSIETGRKHQIRRHLSGAGHPIVGDRLYAGKHELVNVDLCLVSCRLAFVSPVDQEKKTYTLQSGLAI